MDVSPAWHEGERKMHALLSVPSPDNPTNPGLHAHYAARIAASGVVVLAATDAEGRPWATMWGGERGCAGQLAPGVLGLRSKAAAEDPVLEALFRGSEMVTPGGEKRGLAGLAVDFETRDRVKFAGGLLVGAGGNGEVRDVQLGIEVAETLGNCPKYITRRALAPSPMAPAVESTSLPLSPAALQLISRADTLVIASAGGETMDANQRGGAPGFIRVARNDEGGVVLAYPEYSGNRLYQTLGNLMVNPAVGITIPNFETGDALFLTGKASILHGPAAASLLPHTPLALSITISAARHLTSALPFRASSAPTPSPYNPPVRHLLSEKPPPYTSSRSGASARLAKREILGPSIARVTLELTPADGGALPGWEAGEAVTLDFAPELDGGYAHMRDDDPQALNDDFVRTFTVSSPPAPGATELQITIRKKGPATGLLWRYNPRAELILPVLGFGGTAGFLIPRDAGAKTVFVAGGVGITPLLAQAPGILPESSGLSVLWGLRGEDLGFAHDCLQRVEGLARATSLFVTGGGEQEAVDRVRALGARVERGRMGEADLPRGEGRKFHVCAGGPMMGAVLGWLEGEDVAHESFSY